MVGIVYWFIYLRKPADEGRAAGQREPEPEPASLDVPPSRHGR
jgi:hypothetical protein